MSVKNNFINLIIKRLKKGYPNPSVGIDFGNPWQLLVATILAAQCTDERVNKATPIFFKKYPTPHILAKGKLSEIEDKIKSIVFYKNKAKNIKEAAVVISNKHNGKVPSTMEELIRLPGVARKTANVLLNNAFNKPEGIVVDTHVLRVCFRLGLTAEKTPDKVEKDLMSIISDKSKWGVFSNLIKLHGQKICKGNKPLCEECFLNDICLKTPYNKH